MINQLHSKTADKLSAGWAREGVVERVPWCRALYGAEGAEEGAEARGLHM